MAIRIFGDNDWTSPSTMASTGHLYSFDMSKNAAFPAHVSSTGFYENGTALASKYLGISSKAADSDKLDGHDSSYFQKALPTTSTAGKILKSTSTAGTVEWGDAPDTGITAVQINGTSIVTNKVANFLTNTAYNASSNKIATMADLPEGINVVTINNVTLPASASGDDYTITQADYTKATSNSDCIVILKDTSDNVDFAIHRYNLTTTSPKTAYFIIAYPVTQQNMIACLTVAITGASSTYKAHVTLETTPLGKNYVLDNTKSSGIKFLEDVIYTSASSSGSNTVSKSTHTHSVVVSGTTGNDSGTGTTVASTTHTHPVTLTANNETATGRITYLQDITYTAASLGTASTGTVTISNGSYSLSGARTTSGSGATARRTLTISLNGSAPSLGGTKTFVTGYPNFSGGSESHTTKYLSASTSATTSTNTIVASHTHTHSYGSSAALTTGDGSNATATAVSGITSGSLTKTIKHLTLEEDE